MPTTTNSSTDYLEFVEILEKLKVQNYLMFVVGCKAGRMEEERDNRWGVSSRSHVSNGYDGTDRSFNSRGR